MGQQGGAGGRTEATAEAPCDNSGHIFDSTDCYGFTVQPQSSPPTPGLFISTKEAL